MYLAIETSTARGSLAIGSSADAVHEVSWLRENESKGSHSEKITQELIVLLEKSGRTLDEIKSLIVSVGPGSFTGIRVAINFAKSLGYARNLPLLAVNSLFAHAATVPPSPQPLLVMTNAFRNLVFVATYNYQNQWIETHAPSVTSLPELEMLVQIPHNCIGSGWSEYQTFLPENSRKLLDFKADWPQHPSARALIGLVANAQSFSTMDWKTLSPLYLRRSAAEESLKP